MTKQVQRRRGTATQHTSFTGAEGELSVNTTNKSVHVHDNVTAGGFEAARVDMDNVTSSSILTAAGIAATTTELNYVDGVTSAIQTQIDGKAGTASPTFTGTLTTANLTATGTTTLAGASTSADITFGDNDKAIFGAGSDLQIYHDGTRNYIDSDTTELRLQTSELRMVNSANTEIGLKAVEDGAVTLYYDANPKLATSSSGVDIEGTLTSDGLTVDGNATIQNTGNSYRTFTIGANRSASVNTLGRLDFDWDGTPVARIHSISGTDATNKDNGDLVLSTSESGTLKQRLFIDQNGDISFYEDTGTTPKFFWDASAESLALGGLSSPDTALQLYTNAAGITPLLKLMSNRSSNNGTEGASIDFVASGDQTAVGSRIVGTRAAAGANMDLRFHTGRDTERMRIDSSGNVGIGIVPKTGGSTWQHVQFGGTGNLVSRISDTTVDAMFASNYYVNASGADSYITTGAAARMFLNDSTISFDQAASGTAGSAISWSEAMRISDGNLLVGQSSTALPGAGNTTTGISVSGQYDALFISRSSGSSGVFNRNSFGDILQFRKSGATVGSIGTIAGDLTIGDDDIGIRFDTGSGLVPWDLGATSTGGSARDAAIDIGVASARFKDLYLSGKIAASNSSSLQFGSTSCAIEGTSSGADYIKITTNSSEAMRIDSSGNLLVGKTATGLSNQGAEFSSTGQVKGTAPSQVVGYFNRTSSDGSIVEFRQDNATVGVVGNAGANSYFSTGDTGLLFAANVDAIIPTNQGATRDNAIDLGNSGNRFDDIFATNGTIQTSDANEKQDIAELTDAEQRVAVAAKGLLRKFRWRDAVEAKGDDARTHFGIIAQDLQAAFTAEGLDAGDYAMFISSTWTDEETGEERTRMGVRYSELLAFIIAAI